MSSWGLACPWSILSQTRPQEEAEAGRHDHWIQQ